MADDKLFQQFMQAQQANEMEPEMPEQPAMPQEPSAMDKAYAERDKRRMFADLLGGFQQLATAASPGVKADMSMANALRDRANDPVRELMAKQKAEKDAKVEKRTQEGHEAKMEKHHQDMLKADLDFTDMKANSDPKSGQSKFAQDRVLQKQKELGQPVNEESVRQMSGKDLYKYFPYLQQDLAQHYRNVNKKHDDEMSAYQKRSLALRERELGLREKGETRRGAQFEHKKEEKDELSDKQTETITALDTGDDIMKRVDALMSEDMDEMLGPVASRYEGAKSLVPGTEGADENFVKVRALVGENLAKYVKNLSGTAASDAEIARLQKNVPNVTDKPKEFKAKLKIYRETLKDIRKRTVDNIKKQGKDPSQFMGGKQALGEQPSADSGMVKMQIPDGRVKMIPKDMVEKAKKAGAKEI